MNPVKQEILRPEEGFPTQINICQVSQRYAGDAAEHLTTGKLLPSGTTLAIGIACHVSDQGQVQFVALANTETIFCITFNEKANDLDKKFLALLEAGGGCLEDEGPECCLVGFSMARTAVQVYHAVRQCIRGVDLATLSTNRGGSVRASPADVVADSLGKTINRWEITRLWLGDKGSVMKNVCLQAWLAACIGQKNNTKLKESIKINTGFLNISELECTAKMAIQSDLIEKQKPKVTSSDFHTVTLNKDGKAEIGHSRYKTRIRRSDNAQVVIMNKSGKVYTGNAQRSQGKIATVNLHGRHRDIGVVTEVRVVGRPELTTSEKAHEELIHLLLTGRKSLLDSAFIRAVWFPQRKALKLENPTAISDQEFVDGITAEMKLNESQRRVVRGMVGDVPIIVAHGPPGTGKTTTIAAASQIWNMAQRCVWIVAHSNVAVKNIGETLFKRHIDFKLLVAKEFFEEWHEHLYEEIRHRVIRSDVLPKDVGEMAKMIGRSRIFLCTLSMLSNPALHNNGIFKIVPMERLIIDEASQINIFEFMHIFKKFQPDLRKVCFFGDPEQLPPFGQDKVPTIQTIFDLPHIVTKDFFLDIQYRMPVPIGNFISKAMYNNRLKSHHIITDPKCVKFINVSPPRAQETKSGFSWTNEAEVISIVHLVKHYYKNTNFCVITPYDAQRAAIERALKAENLPWESVYNLDSFQGNEADYLLISVVRTGSQPGFLASRKRMNVLLTRCRKATIIVTSKPFMAFGGAQTLLAKMVSYWEEVLKMPEIWVDWSLVAEGRANLPDAPGPNAGRYRQMTYVDPTPASCLSYRPPATPPVPIAYRGPSGGFCVSALFRARPKSASIIDTKSDQPTPNEQTVSPLIWAEKHILENSWQDFGAASNTVREHSFLGKASKGIVLSKIKTLPPPRQHSQAVWPTCYAPVSAPSGEVSEKGRGFDIGDMACLNLMMQTNIYRRRR